MIIINVRNGLGNRLFIYAFGEYLSKKFNQEVLFDESDIESSNPLRVVRDINSIFSTSFKKAAPKDIRKYVGKKFYIPTNRVKSVFVKKVLNKINSFKVVNKEVVYIEEPSYWNVEKKFVDSIINYNFVNGKIYYLKGFWENMSYMREGEIDVRKLFIFREKVPVDNPYYNDIINSNSVALHIRRGDYLTESNKQTFPKNIYDICGQDYYEKAIKVINEKKSDLKFFVFTDDPDYVEKKYEKLNKVIVKGNSDVVDMQLMSFCKHCIIANSTFSLWGALLNSNNGIVIAPKIHYIHMVSENEIYKNMFFKINDWIYIDNYTSDKGIEVCH